jgi:hypothetical protein
MAVTTAQLIGAIISIVTLLFAIYVFARVLSNRGHWNCVDETDFTAIPYQEGTMIPFHSLNRTRTMPSKIKRQKREKRPNLLTVSKRVRYAHRRNKKG